MNQAMKIRSSFSDDHLPKMKQEAWKLCATNEEYTIQGVDCIFHVFEFEDGSWLKFVREARGFLTMYVQIFGAENFEEN